MINLVPQSLQGQMIDAALSHPDLFGKDERSLYKELSKERRPPSPTDNRLRLKFWDEYNRAQEQGDPRMNLATVYAGICSREFFSQHFLTRPEKVAWLMCPPASYMVKMEEALSYGIDQLRDVLELDHFDSKGRLNTKLLELKAKIVAMLDMRLKGGYTQRVENKSMNLNLHTNNADVMKAAAGETMETIERRLKELERRDRKAMLEKPPEVVIEQPEG